MPYSVDHPKDLPANVQKMPMQKMKQWVAVWNSAHAACMDKGGTTSDCEAAAFAQANAVVSKKRDVEAIMKIKDFWSRFEDWIQSLGIESKDRAIDEGAWDGSPSGYADTAAYCSACLIDVNSQAGVKGDKVQANCKLPVKSPGSSSYNRKAIHAVAGVLAGGRGGLSKPADVNAADWSAAIKTAANKVISIYSSMNEVAPDSVYRVAGKTPPKKRALDMSRLYQRITEDLSNLLGDHGGVANAGSTDYGMSSYAMPIDLYHEEAGMFLILADQGRLYRMDVAIDANDEVSLSNPIEVTQIYTPVPAGVAQRGITVYRASDGSRRWLMIAASAVLNRVGQIDSMSLFDSLVENATKRGMPYLTFWHQGESLMLGVADYVARENYLYIATGIFNSDALAQAAADGLEKSSGEWGASISYYPLSDPIMVEVIRDVHIPVYTSGWNDEISVLPQEQAANWFTITISRENVMRKDVKEALVKLVGSDLADRFAQVADETNRSIETNGLITREATITPEITSSETQVTVAAPSGAVVQPVVTVAGATDTASTSTSAIAGAAESVVELDDAFLKKIVAMLEEQSAPRMKSIEDNIAALTASLQPLKTQQTEIARSLEAVAPRLDALEQDEDERRTAWTNDLPAPRKTRVTYRARNSDKPIEGGHPEVSMTDTANATLAAFKTPMHVRPRGN